MTCAVLRRGYRDLGNPVELGFEGAESISGLGLLRTQAFGAVLRQNPKTATKTWLNLRAKFLKMGRKVLTGSRCHVNDLRWRRSYPPHNAHLPQKPFIGLSEYPAQPLSLPQTVLSPWIL